MKTLLILFLSAITASAAVGVAPSGGGGSGAAQSPWTGNIDGANYALSSARYVNTAVNISGTDIDWSTGTVFSKSLAASPTFTFSNITEGQRVTVVLTNGGSWTVTWPTVTWLSGSAPVMDTGAGTVNVFTFMRQSGVTFGDVAQKSNAKIDAIAALANSTGALTNDGSGTFGYYALSTANLQASLGSVYQSTNSFLTTLAALGAPTEAGSRLSFKPDGTFAWVTPRNYIEQIDEFNGGAVGGQLGWSFTTASGGLAGAYGSTITGVTPEQGAFYLAAGTAAGGYGAIQGNFGMTYFGTGRLLYEARVAISALSDGTDTFEVNCGFFDTVTSTNVTDGVYFRYINTLNSGKWYGITSSNSSQTTNTVWAGTTTANTWYRLGIDVASDASSAIFSIDGTPIATNTVNIPTTAVRGTNPKFMAYKHAGTNNRYCYLDYVRIYQWLTSTR